MRWHGASRHNEMARQCEDFCLKTVSNNEATDRQNLLQSPPHQANTAHAYSRSSLPCQAGTESSKGPSSRWVLDAVGSRRPKGEAPTLEYLIGMPRANTDYLKQLEPRQELQKNRRGHHIVYFRRIAAAMDPLSITASVVAIIGIAAQAYKALLALHSLMRDAPYEVLELANEVP